MKVQYLKLELSNGQSLLAVVPAFIERQEENIRVVRVTAYSPVEDSSVRGMVIGEDGVLCEEQEPQKGN